MKAIFVLGLIMVLVRVPVAQGDYSGLVVVREFPNQMTAAGVRDVFRVYAEFTNPTDRLDSWYGNAEHPFTIQNVLADGVTLGSGFTNTGGSSGTLPPEQPGGPRDWDTWATIGVVYLDEPGVDFLNTSFGFPVFISGNTVTSNDASVYLVKDTAPQGQAGFRINGSDTVLRVLLMQLTVMPGQHVRGTINVNGQIGTPGSYTSFDALNQTFNSVPGPGAVGAMILAAFCPARRRKRWYT